MSQLLEYGTGGTAATGAGCNHWRKGAQAHGLQDFLTDNDFLCARGAGFGRKGNSNGVADAFLQQYGQSCGGSHNALAAHASLSQTEMQWVTATAA